MSNEDIVAAAEEQIVEQSKRIDFYLTEYTIELLALKMRKGEFVVPVALRRGGWLRFLRYRSFLGTAGGRASAMEETAGSTFRCVGSARLLLDQLNAKDHAHIAVDFAPVQQAGTRLGAKCRYSRWA